MENAGHSRKLLSGGISVERRTLNSAHLQSPSTGAGSPAGALLQVSQLHLEYLLLTVASVDVSIAPTYLSDAPALRRPFVSCSLSAGAAVTPLTSLLVKLLSHHPPRAAPRVTARDASYPQDVLWCGIQSVGFN